MEFQNEFDVQAPIDEVYTAMAISGHTSMQGFNVAGVDSTVFYTATSAGFITQLTPARQPALLQKAQLVRDLPLRTAQRRHDVKSLVGAVTSQECDVPSVRRN